MENAKRLYSMRIQRTLYSITFKHQSRIGKSNWSRKKQKEELAKWYYGQKERYGKSNSLILKDAAELKELNLKITKVIWSSIWQTVMWTKMLRIRNVAEKDDVNFESLSDSLVDMINYAAMFAAYLENKDMDTDIAAHQTMQQAIDKDRQLWEIQKNRT